MEHLITGEVYHLDFKVAAQYLLRAAMLKIGEDKALENLRGGYDKSESYLDYCGRVLDDGGHVDLREGLC